MPATGGRRLGTKRLKGMSEPTAVWRCRRRREPAGGYATLPAPMASPQTLTTQASASPPSASRCPCSRTTFDPAGLTERAAALEAQMGGGVLGRPGGRREGQRRVRARPAQARDVRALEADVGDLDGLVELAEEDPTCAAELEETLASVEERLAALEEERLFSGPTTPATRS